MLLRGLHISAIDIIFAAFIHEDNSNFIIATINFLSSNISF